MAESSRGETRSADFILHPGLHVHTPHSGRIKIFSPFISSVDRDCSGILTQFRSICMCLAENETDPDC